MKTIGKKSLTGTAVFLLFAASVAQQAEAARPSLSTPVLKKGNKSEVMTKSSSRSNQPPNSSSFPGSEDKPSTAEYKNALEAQGAKFAPIDIERIKQAVPPPLPPHHTKNKNAESFAPKSIIDPLDTRVRVHPDTFPARAVVTILFGDGYMCSGALIDSNLVLTAGHCVHDGITPGDDGFYDPATYTIIPGADGADNPTPNGTCGAMWTDTVVGWADYGYDEYDYGVIRLNCSIGDTVGWFGFFSKGQKNHQPAIISGYPADKPGDQWWSSNNVAKKTGRKLFYRNDTYDGMSGSPIWFDKEPSPQEGCSTGGPCIAGVHGYGTDEKNHNKWYRDYNSGVMINDAVYNNLLFWKTMDTPFPGSK